MDGTMDFDVHGRLDFEAPDVIRAEQTRLLNEHLAYCRASSPYYRRILSGRPDRPVTLESLAELPMTGKSELAEFNDLFVALPPEEIADIVEFLLLRRGSAVIDEILVHRVNKEPFLV